MTRREVQAPKDVCRAMFIWSAACRARARPRCSRQVSAALGPRLKRIPDGETGERSDWITWLEPVFADSPALEKSDEVFRLHADRHAAHPLSAQARPLGRGRHVRQPVLCRHRRALVSRFRPAQARGQNSGALPLPDRSGAGAFGDLAVSAGRSACAARSGLQRGAQARDRQDRRALCRTTRSRSSSTWRRRCSRGWSAMMRRAMAAAKPRRRTPSPHPDRSRQPRAARHRVAVSFLLRRFQPQPCGRADRHGRHGGDGEPADARDHAADPADPHAGAARPRRRCLFRAAQGTQAQARKRSCASASCTTPTASTARAQRIAAAEKVVPDFAIATECGFGRRRPDTIPELLRIHAEVAALMRRMSDSFRPLRPDERADWEPLWRGYLDFYKTTVPKEVYDATWARLHDPDEPMWLLGAYATAGFAASCTSLSPLVLDGRRLLLSAGSVRGAGGAQARAWPRADRGGLQEARRPAPAASIGSPTKPTPRRARSTTRWPTGRASSSTASCSEGSAVNCRGALRQHRGWQARAASPMSSFARFSNRWCIGS